MLEKTAENPFYSQSYYFLNALHDIYNIYDLYFDPSVGVESTVLFCSCKMIDRSPKSKNRSRPYRANYRLFNVSNEKLPSTSPLLRPRASLRRREVEERSTIVQQEMKKKAADSSTYVASRGAGRPGRTRCLVRMRGRSLSWSGGKLSPAEEKSEELGVPNKAAHTGEVFYMYINESVPEANLYLR